MSADAIIAAKIQWAIDTYKKNFTRIDGDERYKWEAIGWYKAHWNLDAEDFAQMLAAAFSQAGNLLSSRQYFPRETLVRYAQQEPEAVRALFRMLYDESLPLSKRYVEFRAGFQRFVEPLALSHYQDLHAVSVYLSFEYPETYYIYKYKAYKGFRNLIGFKEPPPAIRSEVWKIENYSRMCDRVLALIRHDTELLEMSSARLDDSCYRDEALHLLTMDVVYFGSTLPPEHAESAAATPYWPTPEAYDPAISKKQWLSVLNTPSVTSTENLAMLKMMLELGGESTCAHLARVYGNVHNYYNRLGSSFGEKVKKKLNCPDFKENGKIRYHPIPFVGRYLIEDGCRRYSWRLRDELREALMGMDLSEIQTHAAKAAETDVGKNTILYGPPGTGKTYHTVIYAVAILEDKTLAEVRRDDYDDVLDRYHSYKDQGRVEFTTFHQSYGYEDFIEGIKPVIRLEDEDSQECGDIEYRVEPGVFKRFCEQAERPAAGTADFGFNDSPSVWKISLEGTGDNPTRTECLANDHIRIGYDFYGKSITDQTDFSVKGGKNVLNAFINKMRVGDIVLSCYSASTIDAVGVVTGDYEWHDEYDQYKRLRPVRWIVKNIREDIMRFTNGITMTNPSAYRLMNVSLSDILQILEKHRAVPAEPAASKQNYVFIIDEINRGNISKIFGELITLVEPSKRVGRPEGIKAKLPYSQKPFGVPENVYLIGTMNTADRSIAAMDTALRRRFDFREMRPDPDVLADISVEDLSIRQLLIKMNRRIEVLYDREHTIGHAYFLPLKDSPTIETLSGIFANSILPLLQEYFYEDYEKIRLVLGDHQKRAEKDQFVIAKNNDYAQLFGDIDCGIDESFQYEINAEAFDNLEAYRSI